VKALVLNALGHAFDVEDVEIAVPRSREVMPEFGIEAFLETRAILES